MRDFAAVFFSLTILAIFASGNGTPKTSCVKNTNACVRSSECCTACCYEDKCVDFREDCLTNQEYLPGAGKGGPCALLDPPCPAGHDCVLQPVQCIQSPCPPIPSCVPPDYKDYED